MLHCIQKNIFWDDAYTQILLKVYLLPIVPLKVQTIEQQPQSLYSPSYMALESTIGSSSTT